MQTGGSGGARGLGSGAAGAGAARALDFGFSGAGLLFPYHLGAASALTSAGLLTQRSRVAGASAGAIAGASVFCGASPKDFLEEVVTFYAHIQRE
jgi:hypothetical protein